MKGVIVGLDQNILNKMQVIIWNLVIYKHLC